MPGEAVAAAGAAMLSGSGPEYLRRSTYAELVGEEFTVRGHALRLLSVGDVRGAAFDRDLEGHEAAFALEFEGPADALDAAIHELHHPLVGPFALYMTPEGPVRGRTRSYGVTVDRSVRLKDVPREPDRATSEPEQAPPRRGEPPPSEPTERDREVVAERVEAARAVAERRRRRTRRARRKLRRTHARRIGFKRKQRTRVRNARTGWLRRHSR